MHTANRNSFWFASLSQQQSKADAIFIHPQAKEAKESNNSNFGIFNFDSVNENDDDDDDDDDSQFRLIHREAPLNLIKLKSSLLFRLDFTS